MFSRYANLYEIRGNATKLNLEDNQQVDFYSSITDSIYNVKGQNKDFPNSTQRENIVTGDGLSFIGENPYLKCICPLKCPACYQNKILPTIPYKRPYKYVDKDGKIKEGKPDDQLPANIGPGGDGPGGKPAGGPKQGPGGDGPSGDGPGGKPAGGPKQGPSGDGPDGDGPDDDIKIEQIEDKDEGGEGDNSLVPIEDEAQYNTANEDDDSYDLQNLFVISLTNALGELAIAAVESGITTVNQAFIAFPTIVDKIKENFPQLKIQQLKENYKPVLQETLKNVALGTVGVAETAASGAASIAGTAASGAASIAGTAASGAASIAGTTATLNEALLKIVKQATMSGINTAAEAIKKLPSIKELQNTYNMSREDLKQALQPYFTKSEQQLLIEQEIQEKQDMLDTKERWLNEGAKLIMQKQDPGGYVSLLRDRPYNYSYWDIVREMQARADEMQRQQLTEIKEKEKEIQEKQQKQYEIEQKIRQDYLNTNIKNIFGYMLAENTLPQAHKIRDQLLSNGFNIEEIEKAFKRYANSIEGQTRNLTNEMIQYLFLTLGPSNINNKDVYPTIEDVYEQPYETATAIVNQVNPTRTSRRIAGEQPAEYKAKLTRNEITTEKLTLKTLRDIAKVLNEAYPDNPPIKGISIPELKEKIVGFMRRNNLEDVSFISGTGLKRKHPVWKKILKGSQLAGNGSKRIKLLLS